ncbi:MAG: substrate-binding domain-containing protein [Verrucomicrobiales bacterium]
MPQPPPPRPSLTQHCYGVIHEKLLAGTWPEGLPGERELAIQLGVSRSTLRKTLTELERDGLIHKRHGRRSLPGPRLRSSRKAGSPQKRKIITLAPNRLHLLPTRAVYTLDALRMRLAESGHSLEVRPLAPQASSQLTQMLSQESDAIWLLYQQAPEIHRLCHESGRDCLVFGTQDARFPLPAVDLDQLATARHAARHLQRLGYQKDQVALVYSSHALPGNILMSQGVREVFGPEVAIAEISLDSQRAPLALDRLVEKLRRPAALILAHTRHTTCALTHFSAVRRLRIPDDLGLLCLNDDPLFPFLHPDIARYQSDAKAVASHLASLALRAINGAKPTPRMTRLFPDFLPGQSLLPAHLHPKDS